MSQYVLSKIESGVDIKELMDMIMSMPKDRRPRIGGKLVYASMYRPIFVARELNELPGVVVSDIDKGAKGLVTSTEPLSPEAIERWELTPIGLAAAWALLSVTTLPIELGEVKQRGNHVRGILIHEGTNRKPRLTFFEEEVGATGHREGDYEELVDEALKLGFRRLAPGLIDNIVGTVE